MRPSWPSPPLRSSRSTPWPRLLPLPCAWRRTPSHSSPPPCPGTDTAPHTYIHTYIHTYYFTILHRVCMNIMNKILILYVCMYVYMYVRMYSCACMYVCPSFQKWTATYYWPADLTCLILSLSATMRGSYFWARLTNAIRRSISLVFNFFANFSFS